MSFSQGTIFIRHHPSQRLRLRQMAQQVRTARPSWWKGKRGYVFVLTQDDRELLTDALYTIAEAVVDE